MVTAAPAAAVVAAALKKPRLESLEPLTGRTYSAWTVPVVWIFSMACRSACEN